MKLGVLVAGGPPHPLADRFGDYPTMFQTLLGADAHDWRVFDVQAGAYPDRPEACEAYIVTGSACGVYDGDPWIDALADFMRAAKGRAALVGVCFGHQIMAQAFGGTVIKSPKGWGLGLHTHDVSNRAPWMDLADAYALPASHQDQVVVLPPAARMLAGSAFCPYGLLAYDDQPAISIQLHPEFAPAYAAALIESRRGVRYPPPLADAAIASLGDSNDSRRLAQWIGAFLERSRGD